MSAPRTIHHINWLVRDLAKARELFGQRLGLQFGAEEPLPARGVVTCRTRIGSTWFVLVQPTDPDGPVAQRLRQHGEGVFLLSFGVDDLSDIPASDAERDRIRRGLEGWRVMDIDALSGDSSVLQVCADPRDGEQRDR
jgi:methylmalonyl-CoA/ethylmalonyl-CoA epimerase